MSNRIEQIISDIEEYIDGCKLQAFSNTKVIVERTQIDDYMNELRKYVPEEVKKYQRMLNNRDKILSDAKKKAQEVEDKAQAYAEHLIQENNVTKMAYDKAAEILKAAEAEANELVNNATQDANQIRSGAMAYTNEMLSNLQSIISGTIDDCQSRYSALISSLSEHSNIVSENLRELNEGSSSDSPDDVDGEPFFSPNISFEDIDDEELED